MDNTGLPKDYFPGSNYTEQRDIAIRMLKNKLRAKFPQTGLTKLAAQFVPAIDLPCNTSGTLTEEEKEANRKAEEQNAWNVLILELQKDTWKDFDLNSSDIDSFTKEKSIAISDDQKEKIKALQRLFRLTDDAEAVSYLIRNEIYSASQIALVDEERFVAEHGLGMGNKELATNIHRLAKSFVASATLDIERYHGV
jgi:hypothetical protein